MVFFMYISTVYNACDVTKYFHTLSSKNIVTEREKEENFLVNQTQPRQAPLAEERRKAKCE